MWLKMYITVLNTIESRNTVNEFSFSKLLYLYSILNYLRLRINYKW